MKRFSILVMLACMLVSQPVYSQFGALKGIAKGAAQKVKDKVSTTTGTASQSVNDATTDGTEAVAGTTDAAPQAQTARGEAPWPMASNSPKYKEGIDFHDFLLQIADVDEAYVAQLHDQMFARFRENAAILRKGSNYDAQEENSRFQAFFWEMDKMLNICTSNTYTSKYVDGKEVITMTPDNAYYLVQSRNGGVALSSGGAGYVMRNEAGKFHFTDNSGTGAFLDSGDLAQAKESVVRMRRWQKLVHPIADLMQECGYEAPAQLKAIYNRCGMYASAVEEACAANTPENIERKPRPQAGAMHSSMKAKALAVAKADDPEVVDVIITSPSWDVKMKNLVPICRNIYGYYIYKDENGLQCYSRMWTEDYQGNGKYGELRKGGVGTGSPFYIK